MHCELAENEILNSIRFFNCQLLVKTDIVFESKNIFIERAGPVGLRFSILQYFSLCEAAEGQNGGFLIEIFLQLSSTAGVSRYKILYYLPVGKRHPFQFAGKSLFSIKVCCKGSRCLQRSSLVIVGLRLSYFRVTTEAC